MRTQASRAVRLPSGSSRRRKIVMDPTGDAGPRQHLNLPRQFCFSDHNSDQGTHCSGHAVTSVWGRAVVRLWFRPD
jgi:hypothetical protein